MIDAHRRFVELADRQSVCRVFLAGLRDIRAKFGGGVEARHYGRGDYLTGFDVRGKVHPADEAAFFVFLRPVHERLSAVRGDAGEDHGDRPAVDAVARRIGGAVHGVLFRYGGVALVAHTMQLHSLIGTRALVLLLRCGGGGVNVEERAVKERN